MLRIGIFLSVLDVHVNRMPMAGRVAQARLSQGQVPQRRASTRRARITSAWRIRLGTGDGADIAVVQIAGLIARRIVCTVEAGEEVIAGQRFGLIRFGSRTDVYLPPAWTPLAVVGQRAVGGETVIADARAAEPQRQGAEH